MSRGIRLESLSSVFAVRRLDAADVELIHAVCRSNPQFYRYCGRNNTKEEILSDLQLTPTGKTLEDKYFIGFFDGESLVAVMDLVDGYPDDTTAFIGFFMMQSAYQGRGTGSAVIAETCAYLKNIGFTHIRLCIDKDNPQSNHFWRRNGFAVLKEVPRDGGVILLAEKQL